MSLAESIKSLADDYESNASVYAQVAAANGGDRMWMMRSEDAAIAAERLGGALAAQDIEWGVQWDSQSSVSPTRHPIQFSVWLEDQKRKARTEGMRCALEAAAQDAAGVIASGDVAECAAFVPGETGRAEAISARDNLYEDPAGWLRDYAAQFKPVEFAEWHDEHREQCPPCNPNLAYDYFQTFEGA